MSKNQEVEFNPVKETVGGKQAEKVIWSTNIINVALKAIEVNCPCALKISVQMTLPDLSLMTSSYVAAPLTAGHATSAVVSAGVTFKSAVSVFLAL